MTASPASYHEPVMVREVVALLDPGRGGVFVDATVGGGGHAGAILAAGADAYLVGLDRDPEALEVARERLAPFAGRFELEEADYADFAERDTRELAGVLLDLGVSSRQLDETERGFSFRPGTPLDMRMAGERGTGPTAADALNRWPEAELARVFREYGEEPRARALARTVVERRAAKPFETSDDFVAAIRRVLGPRMDAQDKARLFQALRIAVNDELGSLERALPAFRDRLRPGGVIVVIAYHSLEDRIVKEAFREWSRECICPPELPVCRCRGRALGRTLTRRPILPSEEEVAANVRARSARLRAWRKD